MFSYPSLLVSLLFIVGYANRLPGNITNITYLITSCCGNSGKEGRKERNNI
jgi:hypothetical protein